jgi:hypothetical protein
MTDGTGRDDAPPALVVVHGGEPSAEELAALVVAMGAVAGTASTASPRPRSGWADRRAQLRRPLNHGPGQWAAGARPTH